ncbi:MAG: hypothetical protein ACLTSZ_10425 [Lachnospiraceae bacterium]
MSIALSITGIGLTGAFAGSTWVMTVGQLSAFLSYANQYQKPFHEISGVITELQNAIACAGRVFELIDEEPQIPDPGLQNRCWKMTWAMSVWNMWRSPTHRRKS